MERRDWAPAATFALGAVGLMCIAVADLSGSLVVGALDAALLAAVVLATRRRPRRPLDAAVVAAAGFWVCVAHVALGVSWTGDHLVGDFVDPRAILVLFAAGSGATSLAVLFGAYAFGLVCSRRAGHLAVELFLLLLGVLLARQLAGLWVLRAGDAWWGHVGPNTASALWLLVPVVVLGAARARDDAARVELAMALTFVSGAVLFGCVGDAIRAVEGGSFSKMYASAVAFERSVLVGGALALPLAVAGGLVLWRPWARGSGRVVFAGAVLLTLGVASLGIWLGGRFLIDLAYPPGRALTRAAPRVSYALGQTLQRASGAPIRWNARGRDVVPRDQRGPQYVVDADTPLAAFQWRLAFGTVVRVAPPPTPEIRGPFSARLARRGPPPRVIHWEPSPTVNDIVISAGGHARCPGHPYGQTLVLPLDARFSDALTLLERDLRATHQLRHRHEGAPPYSLRLASAYEARLPPTCGDPDRSVTRLPAL